ncbi:DUF5672 family protein [Novosphingobium sp. LASN5T]|uniref:DUF5672 family protein n=1 Tax=Novosphingobium sp. LASN5T TaxID=2491021 RepID=UPI001CC210D5|nr:DUF5672 family protein [Novosphingobium sp. LASN5T]
MTGEQRLQLSEVTLCAVTSVNVAATVRALKASLESVGFAACKLLTDAAVDPGCDQIEVVRIAPIPSAEAYSHFLLTKLVDHVKTSHCLVAQWDGHVLDPRAWRPEFLMCDYIGASWPQFTDGHDVGNGGFSLRSRQLMELCRDPAFVKQHPEDIAICRINRDWLEKRGIRFAPRELADRFAAERAQDPKACFGYHGAWNMPRALGSDDFWAVYRELDDRGTVYRDFWPIMKQVWSGAQGKRRALHMLFDRFNGRRFYSPVPRVKRPPSQGVSEFS